MDQPIYHWWRCELFLNIDPAFLLPVETGFLNRFLFNVEAAYPSLLNIETAKPSPVGNGEGMWAVLNNVPAYLSLVEI